MVRPKQKGGKATGPQATPKSLVPKKEPATKIIHSISKGKGVQKSQVIDYRVKYAELGVQIPIVIGPLERTYGKAGNFTCSSTGLVKDGYKFDPTVEKFLPPLEPLLTKKGTIRKHQPYIEEKQPPYWTAQCAFRSLLSKGSISILQERLRKNVGLGIDPELVKWEKELMAEFWSANAAALAKRWDLANTPEQKAERDPVRFLWERFCSGGKDDGAVVLKSHNLYQLHTPASRLGLCYEAVDAPVDADGIAPEIPEWIVIGRDPSAVFAEKQKICDEAVRMTRMLEDAHEERIKRLHKESVSKMKTNPKDNNVWDVTGSWTIRCPYFEKMWGDGSMGSGSTTCSLKIRFTKSKPHGRQLWASFDFIALTGFFRFVNPSASSNLSTATSLKSRRVQHDDVYGISYEEFDDSPEKEYDSNEDSSEEGCNQEEFYLGEQDVPSHTCATWKYRWRGEDAGSGEIQLDEDKELCSIVFGGVGGTELTGTFMSDLAGKTRFTGSKTGPGLPPSDEYSIENEWRRRSSRAYEEARVNRWG